jgi:hypothetical protein
MKYRSVAFDGTVTVVAEASLFTVSFFVYTTLLLGVFMTIYIVVDRRRAEAAARLAKPLDNTDFALGWRKRVVTALATGALKELRGDDPAALGVMARHARRALPLPQHA